MEFKKSIFVILNNGNIAYSEKQTFKQFENNHEILICTNALKNTNGTIALNFTQADGTAFPRQYATKSGETYNFNGIDYEVFKYTIIQSLTLVAPETTNILLMNVVCKTYNNLIFSTINIDFSLLQTEGNAPIIADANSVESLSYDINDLSTHVEKLQVDLDESDIGSLKIQVEKNTTDISENKTEIAEVKKDIDDEITVINVNVARNTNAIQSNKEVFDNYQTSNDLEVAGLKENVAQNTQNITTNRTKIGNIETDLSNTKVDVNRNTNNFANYYTTSQIDNLIAGLDTLEFKKVDSLPPVGEKGIIYLVPEQNGYSEYIWIDGEYEFIGTLSGEVDLSNYYTKAQTINEIVVRLANYYDRASVDGFIDDLESFVGTEIPLETTAQTVVGAINEHEGDIRGLTEDLKGLITTEIIANINIIPGDGWKRTTTTTIGNFPYVVTNDSQKVGAILTTPYDENLQFYQYWYSFTNVNPGIFYRKYINNAFSEWKSLTIGNTKVLDTIEKSLDTDVYIIDENTTELLENGNGMMLQMKKDTNNASRVIVMQDGMDAGKVLVSNQVNGNYEDPHVPYVDKEPKNILAPASKYYVDESNIQPFNIEEAFTERISATNDYEIEDGQAKVIELKGNTIKQIVKNNGYGGFTNSTNYVPMSDMATLSIVDKKIKITALNSNVRGILVTKYGETLYPDKQYAIRINIETNFFDIQSTDKMMYFHLTGIDGAETKDFNKDFLNTWVKFSVNNIMTNFTLGHHEVGVDFTKVNLYLNSVDIIELTDEQALLTVEELEQLIPETLPYGITNSIINSYSTVGNNLFDKSLVEQKQILGDDRIVDTSNCVSLLIPIKILSRIEISNNVPNMRFAYHTYDSKDTHLADSGWITSGKAKVLTTQGSYIRLVFSYVNYASPLSIEEFIKVSDTMVSFQDIPYEPYNKQTIEFPNIELSQWDRLYSPSGDMAVDLAKGKKSDVITLTNTMNWQYRNTTGGGVSTFSLEIGNLMNYEKNNNSINYINKEFTSYAKVRGYTEMFVLPAMSLSLYDGVSNLVYVNTTDTNLSEFLSRLASSPLEIEYETSETTQEQLPPLVSDSLPISNYGLELQDSNGVATTMNIKYLLDDKSQLLELSHDTANLKKKVAELENKKIYDNLDTVTTKGLNVEIEMNFEDGAVVNGKAEFTDGITVYNPTSNTDAVNKEYVDLSYTLNQFAKANEKWIDGSEVYKTVILVENKDLATGWTNLYFNLTLNGVAYKPKNIIKYNFIEYETVGTIKQRQYPLHNLVSGDYLGNPQIIYDYYGSLFEMYSSKDRTIGMGYLIIECTVEEV